MSYVRLDRLEDRRNGVVTYELSDGRRIQFSAQAIKLFGATKLLRDAGVEVAVFRLPVLHHGRQVGTLPSDFDPVMASSTSLLYDVRPGDFRRQGDTWLAAASLGLGDVVSVSGFEPAGCETSPPNPPAIDR